MISKFKAFEIFCIFLKGNQYFVHSLQTYYNLDTYQITCPQR